MPIIVKYDSNSFTVNDEKLMIDLSMIVCKNIITVPIAVAADLILNFIILSPF